MVLSLYKLHEVNLNAVFLLLMEKSFVFIGCSSSNRDFRENGCNG